jgi:hypothetical protein
VAVWLGAVGVAAAAIVVVVALAGSRRPTTSPPVTSPPAPLACVATPAHPLVASRCGHAVVIDGGAVVVDGRPHVVGRAGDVIAVGDWACAGALRAAVLHPSTGEVLLLDAFTPGEAPPVARAERVPGATSLQVRVRSDGCPELGVLEPPTRP